MSKDYSTDNFTLFTKHRLLNQSANNWKYRFTITCHLRLLQSMSGLLFWKSSETRDDARAPNGSCFLPRMDIQRVVPFLWPKEKSSELIANKSLLAEFFFIFNHMRDLGDLALQSILRKASFNEKMKQQYWRSCIGGKRHTQPPWKQLSF